MKTAADMMKLEERIGAKTGEYGLKLYAESLQRVADETPCVGSDGGERDPGPRKERLDRRCRELKSLGPKTLLKTIRAIDWKSIRRREAGKAAKRDWRPRNAGRYPEGEPRSGRYAGCEQVARRLPPPNRKVKSKAKDNR